MLLVRLPRMLSDVLSNLAAAEHDLAVVGILEHDSELAATVARLHSDVVIVGLSTSEIPPSCDELLFEHPTVRVIGVSDYGRESYLYELRPHKVYLGELSQQELLATVRGTHP